MGAKAGGYRSQRNSPRAVLISEDNGYFQDAYQGMPLEGFTPLFEKMLDYPNIQLMLDTDANQLLRLENGQDLFSGPTF